MTTQAHGTPETAAAALLLKYGDRFPDHELLRALLELAYAEGYCAGGEHTGRALIEKMGEVRP